MPAATPRRLRLRPRGDRRRSPRRSQSCVERLDGSFLRRGRADSHDCRGSLIVTGIGKAGLIGQKLTATFASTGAGPISSTRPRRFTAIWAACTPTTSCSPSRKAARRPRCCNCCRLHAIRREADRDDRVGRRARSAGRRRSCCRWGGWRKRARWAWRPARAPPSCWPWAMRWHWSSAGCAASEPRISPGFTRAGRWG